MEFMKQKYRKNETKLINQYFINSQLIISSFFLTFLLFLELDECSLWHCAHSFSEVFQCDNFLAFVWFWCVFNCVFLCYLFNLLVQFTLQKLDLTLQKFTILEILMIPQKLLEPLTENCTLHFDAIQVFRFELLFTLRLVLKKVIKLFTLENNRIVFLINQQRWAQVKKLSWEVIFSFHQVEFNLLCGKSSVHKSLISQLKI